MKKKMQKPEIEFIEFGTADVITTSGGMDAEGENTDSGYGGIIGGIGGFGGGPGDLLQ